jgi:hypothetical protein
LTLAARARFWPLVILVSVGVGGWLRLSGLETRSITHPEMYVPRIPLPPAISEPAERMTIGSILTGTFSSDTHPPGYYLAMFPWTRLFGTSLRAIRLPSALLGVGCIALVYVLGMLIGRSDAGAVAAALLALSGFHVFWSQVARMFALSCFLGLCATVLLVWMVRSARPRPLAALIYVGLILAGIATHVFFWGVFATHIMWTLGNAWGRRHLPLICRAQLAGFALGSPFIAFAGYQSGNVVADLSRDVWRFLAGYAGFGFALPTELSGVFSPVMPFPEAPGGFALPVVVILAGAGLVIAGVGHLWRSGSGKAALADEPEKPAGAWRLGWAAAGVLGALAIAGFILMSSRLPPDQIHPTIRITKALLPLPLVIAAGAFALDALWARLPAPRLWGRVFIGPQLLVALLAIIPFGLLSALAAFRPILNQRGLMVLVPYLLLVIATGLLSVRGTIWILASWLIAAFACAAGLTAYRHMTVDPADYSGFAAAIRAEIRPQDLVFVRKAWYETPIFYYLQPSRYRLVGRNFPAATAHDPHARVWVVLLYENPTPDDMLQALPQYRVTRTISMPRVNALLYER